MAFNVRVQDVVVSAEEEAASLRAISYRKGHEWGSFFVAHLGPHATFPLPVSVECQDAEAWRHRVRQRVRVSSSQEDPGVLEIESYERLPPDPRR